MVETPPAATIPEPPAATPSLVEGAKPAAPVVEPLTMDKIKVPEGFELDADTGKEFLDLLNKQDLSREDLAAGLVELQSKAMTKLSEGMESAWTDVQKQWADEVRADKELGGTNLDPTLGGIAKMLAGYPRQAELKSLMTATGMGNNIEGVRFMKWVSDKLNEGKPATGQPGATTQSVAALLYPNHPA